MAKGKLPVQPMTRKVAYVEDCPEEGDIDTNSVIPQSQKRVNFALKLPENRDNESTLDSGYHSWIGEKHKHKPETHALGKKSHASHRVEIKIKTSGKSLEHERPPKHKDTTKKRTKEKVKLQPVHDKSRLAAPSTETPEVVINDARFTRGFGNVPGPSDVCNCHECQQVLFAQATAAQQSPFITRPQSQSTFRLPSMIAENLPSPAFFDVGRPNRRHSTEADGGFRTVEPGPGLRSTRYEKSSSSKFKTDGHDNSSHRRSHRHRVQHYPEGNFNPKSPIYLNVAQPIEGLEFPSYQLPSYQGSHNYAVPFYPEFSEPEFDYDSQNVFPWWPLDQTLPENNYMYPLDARNGAYSPEWYMQPEPNQQASPYLPSQYLARNNYPSFPPAVLHTSPNTSTFMRSQYNESQTIDSAKMDPSHPPLNLPIRPQTAASFISTKGLGKTKARASTKQEKNPHVKEPIGHNLQGKTLVNQNTRMNTEKTAQNMTESNDKRRNNRPEKINDNARHKPSAHKPSQTNHDCHTLDGNQTTTKIDERRARPYSLTKHALAKLNKEHGDDDLQGICRANSSRSTLSDEGNIITETEGTREKS